MCSPLMVKNSEVPGYFKDWVNHEPRASKRVDKYYAFIFCNYCLCSFFYSLLFYNVRLVCSTDLLFRGASLGREEKRKPNSCPHPKSVPLIVYNVLMQRLIINVQSWTKQCSVHTCSTFYLYFIKTEIFRWWSCIPDIRDWPLVQVCLCTSHRQANP